MKLSLILEARSQWDRAIGSARRQVSGLTREARQADGGIRGMDRSMARAERSAERLGRASYRMGFAIGSAARRGGLGLLWLERRLQFTKQQMVGMAEWSGRLIGGGIRTAALAGAAGLTAAAYKVVTAGLMFEKFRTQLTGTEGSVAAGNKAMDWVAKFARDTPYEIADVMEAYVALKAYGIDPTNGSLRTLGDTSAGMGKSLMQAVEMIADAQTGEFERLKEFGIRASVKNKQVTFSFMQNGKQMTKVAKDTAAIMPTLIGIMNQRFAGGMERLSQTTAGKWSNVMDRMTISAKRVWEGGLSTAVNQEIDRISGAIDKMEQDGSLKKWAEQSGRGIGDFILTVGKMDWQQFGRDVMGVAGAIRDLASAVGELDRFGNGVRSGLNDASNLWGYRNALGGIALDPRGGLRWVSPAEVNARDAANAKARGAPQRQQQPARKPEWLPVPRWDAPASGPAKPVQGKISLEIRTQPGVSARPTGVASSGVNLEVNTGRAMRGAA